MRSGKEREMDVVCRRKEKEMNETDSFTPHTEEEVEVNTERDKERLRDIYTQLKSRQEAFQRAASELNAYDERILAMSPYERERDREYLYNLYQFHNHEIPSMPEPLPSHTYVPEDRFAAKIAGKPSSQIGDENPSPPSLLYVRIRHAVEPMLVHSLTYKDIQTHDNILMKEIAERV